MIDHTHDPSASSWVASAAAHNDFPIQNLPLGVFSPPGQEPRIGAAIGDCILDVRALAEEGAFDGALSDVLSSPVLNDLFALGVEANRRLRHRLFDLLRADGEGRIGAEDRLYAASACTMSLPTRIGGYTDFYAGIVHATNVGRLLRPDNPLMPNYKWIPIGYHGRTSSIRASGSTVRRPRGQLKASDADSPTFSPTRRLDYEVELALWIGEGNDLGDPIAVEIAGSRVAGVSLLNDWSARDVQAWEYQPLGPFLAKNFATTVSPWIVTAAALEPFRAASRPRPEGDPAALPHLADVGDETGGALSIEIDVSIRSRRMVEAGDERFIVGRTNATNLYWTPAQMVAHHTSNGCNLEPGDLLGTGTISAEGREGYGSLMEITAGGAQPFHLPTGEERRFLEDGDEVTLTGRCAREGYRTIGFGECRAVVAPTNG